MSAANWASLITAVVALLSALAAHYRVAVSRRQVK